MQRQTVLTETPNRLILAVVWWFVVDESAEPATYAVTWSAKPAPLRAGKRIGIGTPGGYAIKNRRSA